MKQTSTHGKSVSTAHREVLTGQHLAQLQAALLAAFSLDELTKMVRLELSFDLPAIVPVQGRTLDAITYDLVVWALRKPEVGLQGLLAAAGRTNPQNAELQALQAAWAGLTFAPPACPYPGMRPFTADEQERFYGRSDEVRQAVDALRRHPFLAIIGPSGSGKSSLLAAGLLPALLASPHFADLPWTIQTIRPGSQPQAALTNASSDPGALGQEGSRLLLVVDQFEELFTVGEAAQREPFVQALLEILKTPNCCIVLACRADFYANLMSSSIWPQVRDHRLEIAPPQGDALRAAIAQPAASVGVELEPALVERLLADAGEEPGVLPFIQETLVMLWAHADRLCMGLEAYTDLVGDKSGRSGLQVALARHADHVYLDLLTDDGQRWSARRMLLRLVQFGEGRADTRRQQTVEDLQLGMEGDGGFEAVLVTLTAQRLLTLGEEARRVDLAHEALIGGWPRLREWIEERRAAEITRRRLEESADARARLRKEDVNGGLLDVAELAEAEKFLASPDAAELGVSSRVLALIADSRRAIEAEAQDKERAAKRLLESAERLRRRNLGLAIALAAALVAVAVAVVFFFNSQREAQNAGIAQATAEANAAEAQRQTAQSQTNLRRATAHRLALKAEGLIDENPQLAILLAAEGIRVTLRTAEETVQEARATLVLLLDRFTARPLSQDLVGSKYAAFTPDGSSIVFADDTSVSIVKLDPLGLTESSVSIPWSWGTITNTFGPIGAWFMAQSKSDGTENINNYVINLTSKQATKVETQPLSLSMGGRWLIVVDEQHAVHLVDTQIPTVDLSGVQVGEHLDDRQGPVLSEDGRWLAMLNRDRSPQLVDLNNHAEDKADPSQLLSDSRGIRLLRFSSNSRWLAAADTDNNNSMTGAKIDLWRLEGNTWRVAGDKSDFFPYGISLLDVSPRGNWMAIVGWKPGDNGDNDSYVTLWNLGDKEHPQQLQLPAEVNNIAFSSDDHWIAAASRYDSTVRVWDLTDYAEAKRDGRALRTILDYDVEGRGVAALRFLQSRDSLLVLAERPQIWHLDGANPPKVPFDFLGQRIDPGKFAFSPNKDWMVTINDAGVPWLWMFEKPSSGADVPYSRRKEEDLLRLAAQVAGRNLTQKEWSLYVASGGTDAPQRTFEEFSDPAHGN